MLPDGTEHTSNSPGNSTAAADGAAKSAAELKIVINAWSALPLCSKVVILDIVRDAAAITKEAHNAKDRQAHS
jgi:hypothetical protein